MSSPIPLENLPVALLRISPLVLTTATLMFSWDQDAIFRAFTHPSVTSLASHPAGSILPYWFPRVVYATKWNMYEQRGIPDLLRFSSPLRSVPNVSQHSSLPRRFDLRSY